MNVAQSVPWSAANSASDPSLLASSERVEPPRNLVYRWVRAVGEEQRKDSSTLVEFTLDPEGDHTRLRVVESGFQDLPWSEDKKTWYANENIRGWQLELDELREYASKHVRR